MPQGQEDLIPQLEFLYQGSQPSDLFSSQRTDGIINFCKN